MTGLQPIDRTRKRRMIFAEKKAHSSSSIVLYASNLMRKAVPEKHAQIPDGNLGIRRLTPEMVGFDAFARCSKKPNQAVSSFLVEQSHIFDLGFCYPTGVMY
jgi:hypothetical protein